MRLGAPLLLALGLPVLALVLARLRHLPAGYAGRTRRAIQACLALSALAGVLALARLELGSRLDRMAVVFVVDRSRSADRPGEEGASRALEEARRAVERMGPDDLAGLVVFGAEAATEIVPSPRPELSQSRAPVPRDATDIGAAIRRALADLPAEHAGRIVLVSDGAQTEGDALGAAQVARGRGVPIDVLPLEREPRPEIAVERVQMPRTSDPDEPVELRIVTRATAASEVRVRVSRDGVPIAEGTASLAAGGDVLRMRDVPHEPGMHRYDVLLEPTRAGDDGAPENNEGGALLRVSGGARALVLSDRPEEAEALAGALRGAGLRVEVAGRSGVPLDLASLSSYDLVVLSDLNARAFTTEQLADLRAYVHELGGGLLMAGARDAFGLGGFAYTPVEEVLPATFDLRRRRDRASLAMVIAIDRSGSMGVQVGNGLTKLDLANEAAARSAELLSPTDRVAVTHVDTEVTWTLPMTAVHDPHAIAAAVRRAQVGGGGIFVDVALDASYGALRAQSTQLRHLLLFSDGSDSEQMTGARGRVAAAAREGITTSIVSMGRGTDTPELEVLSRLGGGRFYIVDDLRELPRIFTQETIAASRAALVEEAFRPTLRQAGAATAGLDLDGAPALDGYVVVNARERATVLLGARQDDPLLLQWQSGVGRSAVFATDAGAHYGRAWLGWSGYPRLFGQLGRALARAPEQEGADVSLSLRGETGTIRVEEIDAGGRYRNYLELVASVAMPGGRSVDVPLVESGSGRYEGRFDAHAPGAYLATVRQRADGDGEGGGLVGTAGLVRARGDELRGEGTDHALLEQIAALTGGQVRRSLERTFVDRPPPTWAWAPLFAPLLALTMLSLLASVALRRLVWPRKQGARARTVGRSTSPAVPAAAPASAIATGGAVPTASAGAASPGAVPARAATDDGRPQSAAAEEAPTAQPAPPPSLAENLLARRRKKK